jgi:transposase-like protein
MKSGSRVKPSKKPVPVYTNEKRAKVLAHLKANGGNLKKTARQFGIPHTTILRWRKAAADPSIPILPPTNPNPAELPKLAPLVVEAVGELAADYEQYARKLMAIDPRLLANYGISLREVGVNLGILAERILLLRGQPNNINQDIPAGGNVLDFSKLTYDQLAELQRWVRNVTGDRTVHYNPRPGEPGYKTGLEPQQLTAGNPAEELP